LPHQAHLGLVGFQHWRRENAGHQTLEASNLGCGVVGRELARFDGQFFLRGIEQDQHINALNLAPERTGIGRFWPDTSV